MADDRVYNHRRRVCQNHSACNWPLCNCPPAPEPEITDDRPAIRAALKEDLRRKTVRVKSILP